MVRKTCSSRVSRPPHEEHSPPHSNHQRNHLKFRSICSSRQLIEQWEHGMKRESTAEAGPALPYFGFRGVKSYICPAHNVLHAFLCRGRSCPAISLKRHTHFYLIKISDFTWTTKWSRNMALFLRSTKQFQGFLKDMIDGWRGGITQ